MPRRKPTNVLALNGTLKAHPEIARAREKEPLGDGVIGDPPAHLSAREKGCWAELVELAHSGSLVKNDRVLIEHGARVLAQLRSSKLYHDVKLMTKLEHVIGKLGMSPADRSKIQVDRPKPARASDEFKKSA
jgi:hypothetical protein